MRQDTGQMSEETFVYSEQALRFNSLVQAVEHAVVEVAGLVIHPGHDRVCPSQLAVLHTMNEGPYREDA